MARTQARTLPVGSEFYIADKVLDPVTGIYKVTGLLLEFDPAKPDETPTQYPMMINYNPRDPNAKIFSNNADDLFLASHTQSMSQAHYLKTTRPVTYTPLSISAFNEKVASNPDWKAHFYQGRKKNMTLINDEKPITATDANVACPREPQRKYGDPCGKDSAQNIHESLINDIYEVANAEGIRPEVLASIIQIESGFNPFIENQAEKTDCINKAISGECPTNGWGKGLAQLGKANSKKYGLNWNEELKMPLVCRGSQTSEACYRAMNEHHKCRQSMPNGQPWNCPKASLRAAAKKIAGLIPKEHYVWVKNNEDPTKLEKVNITEKIYALPVEEQIRAQIAIYNRGPRYLNSWADFYDQNGKWPVHFGELWTVPRVAETASKVMGYQMLTNEFSNRCYVFRVAGLCGGLPRDSVARQFQKKFAGHSTFDQFLETGS